MAAADNPVAGCTNPVAGCANRYCHTTEARKRGPIGSRGAAAEIEGGTDMKRSNGIAITVYGILLVTLAAILLNTGFPRMLALLR